MLRRSNQPWTRGSRHCEANEAETAAQRAGAGPEAGYGSLCRLRSRVRIWFGSLARFSILIREYRGEQGHRLRSRTSARRVRLHGSGGRAEQGSRRLKPQPSSKAKAARLAV